MEDLVPVHLLLMSNSAQVGKDYELCFDLKGSIVNRKVPEHEIKPKGTLKDVNLQEMRKAAKSDPFLQFRQKDRLKLFLLIQVDIMFLCRYNLMDYSLLLFVELNPNYQQPQILRKKTTFDRQRNTALNQKDTLSSGPSSKKPSIGSEVDLINQDDDKEFFNVQHQVTRKLTRKQTYFECKFVL